MSLCGLDFGTSNSTLGVMADGEARLVALEEGAETLPSAIFFDFAGGPDLVGRAALAAYIGGRDGRLMRSVKSVLGTDLIDQETMLDRQRIGFRTVIARLLAAIKRRAEEACGRPLDKVVHGRPVRFVDGDDAADARAEAELDAIARAIGFSEVSFQYEPIAAALDYERHVDAERIALIADIGGGTSDVSVIRVRPGGGGAERARDILANDGARIGGTDFDQQLSLKAVMPYLGYRSPMRRQGLLAPNQIFSDLATWSKINFLYTPQARAELQRLRRDSAVPEIIDRLIRLVDEQLGHWLAMEVEQAKIALSAAPSTAIDLGRLERGLPATIDALLFEAAAGPLAGRIADLARRCIADAGLAAGDIDAVFLTGGTTLLPVVRRAILGVMPEAHVVDGDKFGSVGTGLTLEAMARYG